MTDYSPTAPAPVAPATPAPVAPATPAHRATPATTGPLFDRRDMYAFIAAAVITLAPLAMGGLWVPYH